MWQFVGGFVMGLLTCLVLLWATIPADEDEPEEEMWPSAQIA